MNEQIKLRLLHDIDRFTSSIPQCWYAEVCNRNVQAFKSLLTGHRKTMPLWQQMKVFNHICQLYNMYVIWDSSTSLCHLHIQGAPACYDETINGHYHCATTYHGEFTPQGILHDIYSAMQQTQSTFKTHFAHHKNLMDPASRTKFEHCLSQMLPV